MKQFELTTLLLDGTEEEHNNAIEEIKNKIKKFGGEVSKVENEGRKRLAYSVMNQDFATYIFFIVELPNDALTKISGWLNIYDQVIRYLLVRTDA